MFINQAKVELQLATEKDIPLYLRKDATLNSLRRQSKLLPAFKLPDLPKSFGDANFDLEEYVRKKVEKKLDRTDSEEDLT